MRRPRTDRRAFRMGEAFRDAFAAAMARWREQRSTCRMPGHQGCRHAPREPRLGKIGVVR